MSQPQKSKPRLGRGLSSLISVSELPVEQEITPPRDGASSAISGSGAAASPATNLDGEPLQIPVDSIRPNPHQPRKNIAESAVAELAASIKTSGVIQPIIVRRRADGYELIAGERRWRASRQAGLATIPAIVRDVDAPTQAQLALIENIQREDLNPIDRAQGYRTLMDQLGLTQAEIAGRLGEERSSIANYLRLLDLADSVRERVRDGQITLGHGKLLAGIADILEQQRLADVIVSQSLSVRNLERLLQAKPETLRTRAAKGSAAHLQDLERSLARQLGMRVQVRSGAKGKGRLILHYNSLDQFDDLLQKLGVSPE
jgi:ParB family chromosome partitioning protein